MFHTENEAETVPILDQTGVPAIKITSILNLASSIHRTSADLCVVWIVTCMNSIFEHLIYETGYCLHLNLVLYRVQTLFVSLDCSPELS